MPSTPWELHLLGSELQISVFLEGSGASGSSSRAQVRGTGPGVPCWGSGGPFAGCSGQMQDCSGEGEDERRSVGGTRELAPVGWGRAPGGNMLTSLWM